MDGSKEIIFFTLAIGASGMLTLAIGIILFVFFYQRKLLKRKVAYQQIEDLLNQQELKNGRSRLYAVRRTYLSTGKAIIITTIILLGGFGSLMFSAFLTTFYIGLFVTMTLVLAVITDLTLLPLLLLGTKKAYLKPMV
jgi:uncharacterized membrane protein YdfJ with MMPL/SSD domain